MNKRKGEIVEIQSRRVVTNDSKRAAKSDASNRRAYSLYLKGVLICSALLDFLKIFLEKNDGDRKRRLNDE